MGCCKQIIFFLFLLSISWCGYSQQMVQTPKDINLICQKDDQFVSRPLKLLLQEIKPAILLVLPREGWVPEVAPMFTFFFTSMDVFNQYRRQNKFPLRLTVYLRDPYKLELEKRKGYRDKNHYLDWTKQDEETYGNCIILAIRVAGDYNECDYEPNMLVQQR